MAMMYPQDSRDGMSEREDISLEDRYTSNWLRTNTEIRGWLVVLLVGIALGGIRSVAELYLLAYDDAIYIVAPCLLATDIALAVLVLGVAVYTIVAFVWRRSNAVFWAKVHGWIILLTNAFSLVCNGNANDLAPMVCGAIWLLYLSYSGQVKRVIPKPFRRVSMADWACLSGIIALPIILLCIGLDEVRCLSDYRSHQEVEYPISPALQAPTEYEYDDSRVAPGKSRWDPNRALSLYELEHLEDIRGHNQSGISKLANGIGKGVITTGTTFVGGTLGIIVGGAEALITGDAYRWWCNEITMALQSVSDWQEKNLANYYTEEEHNREWYENLGTANFWGDKFIKELGFYSCSCTI